MIIDGKEYVEKSQYDKLREEKDLIGKVIDKLYDNDPVPFEILNEEELNILGLDLTDVYVKKLKEFLEKKYINISDSSVRDFIGNYGGDIRDIIYELDSYKCVSSDHIIDEFCENSNCDSDYWYVIRDYINWDDSILWSAAELIYSEVVWVFSYEDVWLVR